MTAKYTPGPWFVALSDNATPAVLTKEVGLGFTRYMDFEEYADDLICWMPAEITKSFNSYKNARLISAAPDMVQALWYAGYLLYSIATEDNSRWTDEATDAVNLIKHVLKKADVLPYKPAGAVSPTSPAPAAKSTEGDSA